jgi:hypothetical protein
MTGKTAGPAIEAAWRSQATVKLVGRRREALLQLAQREAPGCSPVDAIDRAIDLAMAERNDKASAEQRLEAIEDTLEAMDSQRRSESARVEAALSKLDASVARLHALISEVAASDESSY